MKTIQDLKTDLSDLSHNYELLLLHDDYWHVTIQYDSELSFPTGYDIRSFTTDVVGTGTAIIVITIKL